MTRGPQHRTIWQVEPFEHGYVVTASLDDYRIAKAFTNQQLLFGDQVHGKLNDMQRQLNTIWHFHRSRFT